MGLTSVEALVMGILKESGSVSSSELAELANLSEAAVSRAILSLKERGLVEVEEREVSKYELTEEGILYGLEGLPERKVAEAVWRGGEQVGGFRRMELGMAMRLAGVKRELWNATLGWIKRKGYGGIGKIGDVHYIYVDKEPGADPEEDLLREVMSGKRLDKSKRELIEPLKKRGVALERKTTEFVLTITDAGLRIEIVPEEGVAQLMPEMLAKKSWRGVKFKPFNVVAEVETIWPGKKHPYYSFLDEIAEKLVSMGFEEMHGGLVELMFFNCDALFMPQDHPAREIHDMYFLKEPKYGDLGDVEDIVRRVKETHERGWATKSKGWRYPYSLDVAMRTMLRSHATALSVRTLIRSDLKKPGKYFAIARVFRPDLPDATHLPEFNHVEGIVIGENLSIADLLGILEEFAVEFAGATAVEFKPDYFPFTEPSVEMRIYKEGYGWIEAGGAGMFRPEVTYPLGIREPVIAWGLGADRFFMMRYGISDIREIFTKDLNLIRKFRMV